MELKQKSSRCVRPDDKLLIVPYGIETASPKDDMY